jgi:DNA-binding NarL/FixJ family response regulator
MGLRQQRKRELASEAAARLYRRGLTYREIAEQLGITLSAAKSHVRAALGDAPARVRQEQHAMAGGPL